MRLFIDRTQLTEDGSSAEPRPDHDGLTMVMRRGACVRYGLSDTADTYTTIFSISFLMHDKLLKKAVKNYAICAVFVCFFFTYNLFTLVTIRMLAHDAFSAYPE